MGHPLSEGRVPFCRVRGFGERSHRLSHAEDVSHEVEKVGLGLTRLRGPIRVKRSGSVKGVEDGQERQALLA